MANVGIYIASRASLPERSAAWRQLRDADGWKITCTWIDEAGVGESSDLGLLWVRIEAEIASSGYLILYVEPEDFPLKGALIEVGMALAHRLPIRVVAPGVVLDPTSFRPLGSWVRHPLVRFCHTMEEALHGTRKGDDAVASAPERPLERRGTRSSRPTEESWCKVFKIRCRSRQGLEVTPAELGLCMRANRENPTRYEAMDADVFDTTVPFGSQAKAKR